MMMEKKTTSHCWWFDSHNNTNTKRSPWLQSTLAELEGKTQAMLKVIEEDADSFAKRAEMYYKKRPELINMVEDFYRAHRSLAERYDLVKLDSGNRLLSPWKVISCTKSQLERSISVSEKSYDSYSDVYELEESDESEVDDPDPEDEEEVVSQVQTAMQKVEVPSIVVDHEVMKLKEEIERLKLENRVQREQLVEKDEEKREVIRQLSQAMDMLREENVKLRKISKKATTPKKQNFMEVNNKPKEGFWKKLFSGSQGPQPPIELQKYN